MSAAFVRLLRSSEGSVTSSNPRCKQIPRIESDTRWILVAISTDKSGRNHFAIRSPKFRDHRIESRVSPGMSLSSAWSEQRCVEPGTCRSFERPSAKKSPRPSGNYVKKLSFWNLPGKPDNRVYSNFLRQIKRSTE